MLPDDVRANLKLALSDSSAEQYFEEIAELIRPAIAFELCGSSYSTAITTRMGGCPDAPCGWQWPVGPEGPLRFLAQVRLEELGDLPAAPSLPASGVLSFFFGPVVYGPESKTDYAIAQVYHFAAETLHRAVPPKGAILHPSTRLEAKPHWDMPIDFEHLATERFYQRITAEERTGVACDLIDTGEAGGAIQLLGYPSREQRGFLQVECEAYMRGYDWSSMRGEERALREDAEEWEVLGQFCLDWEEVWPDGNEGYVHFWIRKRELADCSFDNICYTWERT